jgi:hypothetical protein
MAFLTIFITPGLPPAAHRRARQAGPRAVATRSDYRRLLAAAGFVNLQELDATAAFVRTARAWLDERERHAAELAATESKDGFSERQQDQRVLLAAAEDGLLRRALFTATRPRPARKRPGPSARRRRPFRQGTHMGSHQVRG